MTDENDILLVGEPGSLEQLRTQLGRQRATAAAPYDAMLAMKQGQYRSVVVSAPQAELPGLCRALRRLHGDEPLMAVGPVPSEPEMRSLCGIGLDDYFISPPTRAELDRIRSGRTSVTVPTPPVAAQAGLPSEAPVLSVAQLSGLMASSTSISTLEHAIVELLAAVGLPSRWIVADGLAPAQAPLMTIPGEVAHLLVAAGNDPPSPAAAQLLAQLNQLLGSLVSNARRIESLHKLAITDHLTGAYNRRYFYHLTDQILARASQGNFRVTLLLYDIDNFKHYNETYGHAAGDEILRETAALMKKTSRDHDIVARIGGDEFAVLFWDADQPRSPDSKPLESFVVLAERFRAAVCDHSFPYLGPEARGVLSISAGLANYPGGGQTCRDLLRTADEGLRSAKRHGKDRVYLIGEDGA